MRPRLVAILGSGLGLGRKGLVSWVTLLSQNPEPKWDWVSRCRTYI